MFNAEKDARLSNPCSCPGTVSCNESNQRRCYYQKGLLVIQNIDHHWLTKKKKAVSDVWSIPPVRFSFLKRVK